MAEKPRKENDISRRDMLKTASAAGAAALIPGHSTHPQPQVLLKLQLNWLRLYRLVRL